MKYNKDEILNKCLDFLLSTLKADCKDYDALNLSDMPNGELIKKFKKSDKTDCITEVELYDKQKSIDLIIKLMGPMNDGISKDELVQIINDIPKTRKVNNDE